MMEGTVVHIPQIGQLLHQVLVQQLEMEIVMNIIKSYLITFCNHQHNVLKDGRFKLKDTNYLKDHIMWRSFVIWMGGMGGHQGMSILVLSVPNYMQAQNVSDLTLAIVARRMKQALLGYT